MSSTSTVVKTAPSFSSDYQLLHDNRWMGLETMYSISDQILLTGYDINNECQQFLNQNRELVTTIPRIANWVNDLLNTNVVPLLEAIEDEESLSVRRLSISFRLENRTYEEILKLWDSVSNLVYQKIDYTIAKKIAIALDGD